MLRDVLEFVMKLVKTFGRGKAAADALIESLERRGAVNTARVEPVVRQILAGVRKRRRSSSIEVCS